MKINENWIKFLIESQNYHWMIERWKLMKNHRQAIIWYLWYLMIKIDFLFFITFYLFITLFSIVYFLLSSCWWWWDWWWITSSKLNRFHSVFVLFLFLLFFNFFEIFEIFSLFKNTKLFHVLYDIFNFKMCYLKKGFEIQIKVVISRTK